MAIYQVVSKQRLLGQEIRNVFYYETTSALDAAQKAEVADAFRSAYETMDLDITMAGDWEFYAVDIRQVDAPDLPTGEFVPTSGTLVGTNPGNTLPAQVCMLGRVTGDTAFPRNTRIYQGGFSESHLGPNGLFFQSAADALDLFLVQVDQIVVTGDTLDRVAVNWDTVNNVVDDWNTVNNISVSRNPVIQRRRRLGSGI